MASRLTHTFTQWRSHCMGIFLKIPVVRRVVTAGLGAWPGRGLLSGVAEILSVHLGSGSKGTYRGNNASTYALYTCLFYLMRLKITIIIEAHCKDIDQKFTNTCTPTPPPPLLPCTTAPRPRWWSFCCFTRPFTVFLNTFQSDSPS